MQLGAIQRFAIVAALLVAAVALSVGASQPREAQAHAVLERSLPAQDQRLHEPPGLVETWYTEPLERSLTSLRVLDTQGDSVNVGVPQFSDQNSRYASVVLPPNLAPSVYTVAYQNVSKVDGHAWTGSFNYIVLNPDGSLPAGTAFKAQNRGGGGQGYLPGVGDGALRSLGLLAAVAMVGATAFYIFIGRPSARFLEAEEIREVEKAAVILTADLVVIAVPIIALSVTGQLFLLADRVGGLGTMGNILFNTRTGELWLARIGILGGLLLLFAPALLSEVYRVGGRATGAVAAALVASLGLLMTYSLVSHASAGGGASWGVAADFLHFAATAVWIGALVQLPLLFWWTRNRLDATKRLLYLANALDRFAWLAVISVTLLIGTGVFNGFVQLPNVPSLWETTYGRVLIAKLLLILPLLGVAGINAVFLAPALSDTIDALHEEGDDYEPSREARARLDRRLRRLQEALPRTIAAELLLGVAVLVSVAVLTQTTPASGELRQAAGRPSGEFTALSDARDLNAEISIKPFGIGLSTFTVKLEPKPDASVGAVLDVRLRAFLGDPTAQPATDGSGAGLKLQPAGQPGVWTADAVLLSQPGDWDVETRIRRRGQDDTVVDFSVPQVGGALARLDKPRTLFELPFAVASWNIATAGTLAALGLGAAALWWYWRRVRQAP